MGLHYLKSILVFCIFTITNVLIHGHIIVCVQCLQQCADNQYGIEQAGARWHIDSRHIVGDHCIGNNYMIIN